MSEKRYYLNYDALKKALKIRGLTQKDVVVATGADKSEISKGFTHSKRIIGDRMRTTLGDQAICNLKNHIFNDIEFTDFTDEVCREILCIVAELTGIEFRNAKINLFIMLMASAEAEECPIIICGRYNIKSCKETYNYRLKESTIAFIKKINSMFYKTVSSDPLYLYREMKESCMNLFKLDYVPGKKNAVNDDYKLLEKIKKDCMEYFYLQDQEALENSFANSDSDHQLENTDKCSLFEEVTTRTTFSSINESKKIKRIYFRALFGRMIECLSYEEKEYLANKIADDYMRVFDYESDDSGKYIREGIEEEAKKWNIPDNGKGFTEEEIKRLSGRCLCTPAYLLGESDEMGRTYTFSGDELQPMVSPIFYDDTNEYKKYLNKLLEKCQEDIEKISKIFCDVSKNNRKRLIEILEEEKNKLENP